MHKNENDAVKTLKKREIISYGIGDMGNAFTFTMISAFLAYYYTDSVGISASLIGTIMLVSRIMDGISDLVFGTILDRTNTKMGKAKPWYLASIPAMAIGFVLLFCVPKNLGTTQQAIYIFITYFFFTVIAYTVSNLSYNALLSLMTDQQRERTSASTFRFVFTMISAMAMNILTLGLVGTLGWLKVAILYALLATIFFLITFFGTREHISEQTSTEEQNTLSFWENFRYLFKNKYFISLTVLAVSIFFASGMMTSSLVYFCKDILKDESIYSLLSVISMPCGIAGLILFPTLAARFGKWKCMMCGLLLIVIGSIPLIFSTNVPMVIVGIVLRNTGLSPLSAGLFALVGDVVDYGEWHVGVRQDGMTNSAMSFGMKIGTGLGSAGLGWGLALGQYDGSLAVQNPSAIAAVRMVFATLPMIIAIIGIIVLYFTNIDKIYPQIAADLQKRRTQNANTN